ncbi:hypothetical protein [Gibbsiella quercinecans]|nr:hypothetical protein [Gibbsiella quercinecans]
MGRLTKKAGAYHHGNLRSALLDAAVKKEVGAYSMSSNGTVPFQTKYT